MFQRKIDEEELRLILSAKGIDTRWIGVLRDARILFFHQTAPWLAIQLETGPKRFSPILLKRSVVEIGTPDDFISFQSLQDVYEGFVYSLTGLHEFVMGEIRQVETRA